MRSIIRASAVLLAAFVLAGCRQAKQPTQPLETARREAPAGEVQQVDVALGEWYVRLKPDTVKPGTVQFNIKNVGKVRHALELENGDIEQESKRLSAGESTTMTVTLPAGEYEVYCPVGNHSGKGMRTTLTVAE